MVLVMAVVVLGIGVGNIVDTYWNCVLSCSARKS
jgi:hypothetical protein